MGIVIRVSIIRLATLRGLNVLAYGKSLGKYLAQKDTIYQNWLQLSLWTFYFTQSLILEDYLYGLNIVDVESYGIASPKNRNTAFCHQYKEFSLSVSDFLGSHKF